MMERSLSRPHLIGNELHGIIAFMTDFGLDDPYVGICKGIVASINPMARIIDLSHGIQPQNLLQAQVFLNASIADFPKGTIFLVVVDPGVGTDRAALVVKTDRYLFVGPDNGIFTAVLRQDASCSLYEIDVDSLYTLLQSIGMKKRVLSTTFHARDIFSPAAALLSRGIDVSQFCHMKMDMELLDLPCPTESKDGLLGQILYFDRFGNAISNITRESLNIFGDNAYDPSILQIWIKTAGGDIEGPIHMVDTYASTAQNDIIALFNSFGLLEVAINCGNAQKTLGLAIGDEIIVRIIAP